VLRGPAGRTFKILKVEGEGDGFKAKFPADKSQAAHLIQIEFIPAQPGKVSKTLTIKTDLPGDLSASVVVEGTGTQ
jgi:hypothetical protein